jgi:hypothetical protein
VAAKDAASNFNQRRRVAAKTTNLKNFIFFPSQNVYFMLNKKIFGLDMAAAK